MLTVVLIPPPDRLQIPVDYLSGLFIVAAAAIVIAILLNLGFGHAHALEDIRRE